jgi:isoquinoline 1-oxidoreductase beta subunit
VALQESFGSIVAQVAEVSLDGDTIRVHRVTCAIDCGTVVHPGVIAQQMEGSVIFGISAALYGRIDVQASAVRQGNFHEQEVVRLGAAPLVETWIIASTLPPGGVGEPGVPPVAPAIANALAVLRGERQRSLPLH